jgi:hypothetical protein
MNGYSLIQILLYVFAGILAAIAIFNKSGDNKKITPPDKLIIIGIILTLGFSIVLEAMRADKEKEEAETRNKENKAYTDSLSKIISKSQVLLSKSDSTLLAQGYILSQTDSLLKISNEISGETQDVLTKTTGVIDNQQKDLRDSERERNPVLPISLFVYFKLPFQSKTKESSANISKGAIDTLYMYKDYIEKGNQYDKSMVSIRHGSPKEGITSISFSNPDGYPFIRQLSYLLREKPEYNISVQKNIGVNSSSPEYKESLLFSALAGFTAFEETNIYSFTADFSQKQFIIMLHYRKLLIIEPKNNNLIGISDLINNYLIISPRVCTCNIELEQVRLNGGGSSSGYEIIFSSPKSQTVSQGNCCVDYYYHKIERSEIVTGIRTY